MNEDEENFFANKVFTVSELGKLLKDFFNGEQFRRIKLIGEITSFKESRHWYIDLADADTSSSGITKATFSVTVWASDVYKMKAKPKIGDVVLFAGYLSYYPGNNRLSLIANSLEIIPTLGKNLLKKRELIESLQKKGYLDPSRKKPIPRFVNKLAIVSSATAAGYKDIMTVLSKRFPVEDVQLFPAIVQGPSAPASIRDALLKAYEWNPDVIIMARGGGSKTDLSCFDTEEVANAMIKATCPIISAVGHSIDNLVSDLLADLRAETPTEAAQYINPSLDELEEELVGFKESFKRRINNIVNEKENDILVLEKELNRRLPINRLNNMKTAISVFRQKLVSSLTNRINREELRIKNDKSVLISGLQNNWKQAGERVKSYRGLIKAHGVQAILNRGFSIALDSKGHAIKTVKAVKIGSNIKLVLSDGRIVTRVENIE